MNTTMIDDITTHQERCCAAADEIIGMALRLRVKLKTADNLPIPDVEADALINALSNFIREAHEWQR